MAENTISDTHKVVYLLLEIGKNGDKRTLWRPAGRAYPCRDGSLNLKLDIHPGIVFNIREPKSKAEREEAEGDGETDEEPAPKVQHGKCEQCGHGFLIEDNIPLCPNCRDDYDTGFEIENDRTFKCADCLKETMNDDAHLLFDQSAVCPVCSAKYKSCGRCGYFYPKAIKGTHCPTCNGGS